MILELVACKYRYRTELVKPVYHKPELIMTLQHKHDAVAALDAERFEVIRALRGRTLDIRKGEAALRAVAADVEHRGLVALRASELVNNVKRKVEFVLVFERHRLEHTLRRFLEIGEL